MDEETNIPRHCSDPELECGLSQSPENGDQPEGYSEGGGGRWAQKGTGV